MVCTLGYSVVAFTIGGWAIGVNDVRWQACLWLALFGSLQWIYLRLAHARKGITGEAASDGIVWIVPVAVFSTGSALSILFDDRLPFGLFLVLLALTSYVGEFHLRHEWEASNGDEIVYQDQLPLSDSRVRSLFTPGLAFSHSGLDPNHRRHSITSFSFSAAYAGTTALSLLLKEDPAWRGIWLWSVALLVGVLVTGIGAIFGGATSPTDQRWKPERGERLLMFWLYTTLTLAHLFVMALYVVGPDQLTG